MPEIVLELEDENIGSQLLKLQFNVGNRCIHM